MENYIIGAIVLATAAIGIWATVRHFKGKSGCCGGGGYRPRPKKLSKVLYRKVFHIAGMHCESCKNRVTEIVNDISGLSGRVNLKKGLLTVSYAKAVEDEFIRARIERAGYTVTEICDPASPKPKHLR